MTPREIIASDEFTEYQLDVANQYHKINAQQLAKTPLLLDALRAPDGFQFVQLDFASLEPTIMAEFSGCPTYKEIYASGKPHDPYFFVTCRLLDKTGEIAKVYRMDNPTSASVKAAKKLFKKERSIGKVFQLMSTYKAGARAIYRKLLIEGVDITFDEVKENRVKYWSNLLFGAVLEFEQSLLAEVAQRDGWMFNGLGRPFVITSKKEKDVGNTYCQSTGHDCTDIFIKHVEDIARSSAVPAIPIVPDYHDESIWMTRTENAAELAEVMTKAVQATNDSLEFSIPLRGDPEVTTDFTAFKGPDQVNWYSEKLDKLAKA